MKMTSKKRQPHFEDRTQPELTQPQLCLVLEMKTQPGQINTDLDKTLLKELNCEYTENFTKLKG